jgi:uncharacterized membrane protein YfcA
MDYFLIGLIALTGSLLTFFSGFGLGTILLPVFLLFFSVQEAILMTAVVHLMNNIFKGSLLFQNINLNILLAFGLPSIAGAWLGAMLLGISGDYNQPLMTYELGGKTFQIVGLKIGVGVLMLFFTGMEIIPRLSKLEFSKKWLVPGGILSGLLGGYSGHQGALRTAFLIRSGMTKEAFLATGAAITLGVDLTRISRYMSPGHFQTLENHSLLLLTGILTASMGTIIGNKLLKKTTFESLKILVAVFMGIISVFTILGII